MPERITRSLNRWWCASISFKDRQTFDRLVYQQLLEEGDILLAADLLASRDVVIGPGGDASLNMPLEAEATFVAVVGLFRHPDTKKYLEAGAGA